MKKDKTVFIFGDIAPQLSDEQKEDIQHEIKMAKRQKSMSVVQFGATGRKLAILTNGKMLFVPEGDD